MVEVTRNDLLMQISRTRSDITTMAHCWPSSHARKLMAKDITLEGTAITNITLVLYLQYTKCSVGAWGHKFVKVTGSIVVGLS